MATVVEYVLHTAAFDPYERSERKPNMRPKLLMLAVSVVVAGVAGAGLAAGSDDDHSNKIARMLAGGGAVLGVFPGEQSAAGGAAIVENSNTDFVFYSLENGPFDIATMRSYKEAMHRAVGGASAAANWPLILRVPPVGDALDAARDHVRQGVEAGVSAIVFPHVTTAEEAAAAVAALHDATAGNVWPANPDGDYVNMLIVEDKAGVANALEIAATPGLSVMFAGPGDLRRAYDGDMEAVEEAIQTILAACRAEQVACGVTAGVDDIGRRLRQGFRAIIVTESAALENGKRFIAQSAEREEATRRELAMPNPIPALDSVWMEELTWIEVRDEMAAGKKIIIVSTGGLEQNGPYVATGKHNYELTGLCEGIARALGDALCSSIIKLVPEGSHDPPSGHMRYPGTISVREETFEMMLEDVASSLKAHGFENIIFIGASGGNQDGMRVVADRLNEAWGAGSESRIHFIPELYAVDDMIEYMTNDLGIEEGNEGFHDFFWLTAMQSTVSPESVRYEQRVEAGKASINGVSIADLEWTQDIGRKLIQFRVDKTVKAIRAAIAGS